MIRNRRFVITRYNLGDTKLEATDFTSAIQLPDDDLNNWDDPI